MIESNVRTNIPGHPAHRVLRTKPRTSARTDVMLRKIYKRLQNMEGRLIRVETRLCILAQQLDCDVSVPDHPKRKILNMLIAKRVRNN